MSLDRPRKVSSNLRKSEFKFEKMQFQFKGNIGTEIDKYFHF